MVTEASTLWLPYSTGVSMTWRASMAWARYTGADPDRLVWTVAAEWTASPRASATASASLRARANLILELELMQLSKYITIKN